jgi:hypothetical protein
VLRGGHTRAEVEEAAERARRIAAALPDRFRDAYRSHSTRRPEGGPTQVTVYLAAGASAETRRAIRDVFEEGYDEEIELTFEEE